jgi:hypothetical protein
MKITHRIALNGMHVVQGKVVMGIHVCIWGSLLKNNILVDVTEDYRKMYSSDKLS